MQFLARRCLQALILLWLASFVVFVGVYAMGDPLSVLVSPNTPPETVEKIVRELGLDRPLGEQYVIFLGKALQGELGNSYVFAQPALTLIAERFAATIELVGAAMLIATAIGLPLGLLIGLRSTSRISGLVSNLSVLGISLPTFWTGLLFIMLFSITWQLLPTGGRGPTQTVAGIPVSFLTLGGLRHLALPASTLALYPLCILLRLTEATTREVLSQEFVRFARATGIPTRQIMLHYVLRSVLIPVVTVMGLVFGALVAFSIVTETIFAWPGMGKLIVDSIRVADRPVIVAYILFVVALFVAINALVDLLCAWIDPRVRSR